MIKFGEIKFGTGGIQYASSSGVLISKRSYDEDTGESYFTDPYGNVFRYGTTEKGSTTYYPNNTFTERTFDEYGRLESITHKRKETGGSPAGSGSSNNGGNSGEYGTETTLQSFTYQYDDNGNITKITEANGEYTDYTYDNLSRLTKEEKKTASQETIYKIEYKFDNNQAKNGNIHQVIVNDTDTTTFTYNEMNELTEIIHPDSSTETLTYDNNGNLTQTVRNGETTSYQWDCHDRLTKVSLPNNESVEFDYDEYGLLTKEKSDGIECNIFQHRFFETREMVKNSRSKWEISRVNTLVKMNMSDNEFGGNILGSYVFATSDQKGSRSDAYFYHYNHLGSVSMVTDIYGNILDSVMTDAYGNPIPQGARVISGFNYIGTFGIKYVSKIKLHNMRARWFNSLYRRFISFDLLNFYNRYSYVSGNPVNRFDPFGLEEQQSKIIKTAGGTSIPHRGGEDSRIPPQFFGGTDYAGTNSELFMEYKDLFERSKIPNSLSNEEKKQLEFLTIFGRLGYITIINKRRAGAIIWKDKTERKNFRQNCAGLAFGGKGNQVYIDQFETDPLINDNYYLVTDKKHNNKWINIDQKLMKRGDVVLFNSNTEPNFKFKPNSHGFNYGHVATVAEVDEKCNVALFYERDGHLAIYLSLLSHILGDYKDNKYVVYRPYKKVTYIYGKNLPAKEFAYEAFLTGSYKKQLKQLSRKNKS